MTRYLPVAAALCLLLFLNNCKNRQQTTGQVTDSTAVVTEAEPVSPDDVVITERLADLGLTATSDWRGVNVGDAFAHVSAVEKSEPFEQDAEHRGYTIELKKLETADVLYYQTDKKVSAIDIDLFLNSRQSVTDYQKDLEPYFTARYGAPKPGGGGTSWTGRNGETVTLSDVSKGKDYGLKIRMASAGSPATASAK
ncbi:hypothetical protein [Spirosoma spitsbergense]|uniref:hypothetical protein n=1 Tax=Spirosoma spitsbergense TaxID=431554 RepID=UPI0003734925|nr:hypothetical protein [Spirosoma spitsbergense]